MPANWGFPSPMYNHATDKYEMHGMIWYGKAPMSPGDLSALQKRFGADVQVDIRSACGKADKAWSTYHKTYARKYPYKRTVFLGWFR